jgi:N-acetylglucosamine kinase-like BadF-type ATPase
MILLAVDQGSSKTTAAFVSEQGTILAATTVGGACYFIDGVEVALEKISSAASLLAEKAGASVTDITHVYGGIAGANWPDEIDMLTNAFTERFNTHNATVCNDCVVALRGGTDKPDGVVLCAGTGFNGAAMSGGKIRHVFNNYVSAADQGGGALGGRALQAVFESYIGIREPTVLTRRLMEYYGYTHVDQLLLGRDRNRLKYPLHTTVEILLEAARQNDPVALDVIVEFSKSIARYATGSLKKYDLTGKDCDIVLSGGVFKSDIPLFFETISAEVHLVSVQARIVNAEFEPIVGAALLGLSEAGASTEANDVCKKNARTLGLTRAVHHLQT